MPDLLAKITAAARACYAQTDVLTLTTADLEAWLNELPAARQAEARAHGVAASWGVPQLLRYCLEWRGLGMREFMARQLSVRAFELWERHGEFDGDLPPQRLAR